MSEKPQSISPHNQPEKVLMTEGEADEVAGGVDELFQKDEDKEAEVIDVYDDDAGEEVQGHDQEGAHTRTLPDPGEPTESQKEDHRACGHIPYRTWCRACVEGRSTGEPHRARTGKRGISVFTFDYLHLDASGQVVKRNGDEAEEEWDVDVTILVAKDTMTKAVFAHVVPQKGIDLEHYAVDVLVKDLKWLGHQRVSLRSDNEPAILKLLQHALTESRIEIPELEQLLEEHPNTYDSSGNGDVESAFKVVTGIMRLEERAGGTIPQGHPLFSWLVEYCA